MARSLRLAIQLNNEEEKTYYLKLLQSLFLSMGIGQCTDFLEITTHSGYPVLERSRKAMEEIKSEGTNSIYTICNDNSSVLNTPLPSQSISLIIISKVRRLGRRKERTPLDLITQFPWRFHHRTQLLDVDTMDVVAKQEFYQLSSKLPLVSILEGLSEIPIIRHEINVKSLEQMEKFYSCLLGSEPFYRDRGFCCFDMGVKRGVKLQLSLKKSAHLKITETTNAVFVSHLYDENESDAKLPFFTKTLLKITDPDGNIVEIQQNNPDSHMPSRHNTGGSRAGTSEDEDFCSLCDTRGSDSDFCSSLSACQEDCCSLCQFDVGFESQGRKMSWESKLSFYPMNERGRTDSGFVDKFDTFSREFSGSYYQRTEC